MVIDGLAQTPTGTPVMGTFHPGTLTGALIYLAVTIGVGILASVLIRGVVKRALLSDDLDHTAVLFLRPLVQIVIWVVLLVAYAHVIPQLRALGTAMLAGASVASIVLGVAAQNTLGNLIAGIALLIYRPFRVGDRLQVMAPTGVETGIVEAVSLGYTVLQTFDNRRVVLPNSQVSSQTTINLTSVDPRVMATVSIGVSYRSDTTRTREILLDIARTNAQVLQVVSCPVIQLGNSSVILSLRAWCRDTMAARQFEYDVYEQAKQRLEAAGIEIPYPYYNVVIAENR